MTRPSWRGYLQSWGDSARQEERTREVTAKLGGMLVPGDRAPGPASGRLSGLRGPLPWLSVRPAQRTADGRLVARLARLSWGRDGAWLRYPMCRVGWGHWVPEEWLPAVGWVRLSGTNVLFWPRKIHAVLPGMDPLWRRCGTDELVAPVIATRHLRAALVHWRPVESEIQAAGITAADLLPLLESPEPGVRDGALQAITWVRAAGDDQGVGQQDGSGPGDGGVGGRGLGAHGVDSPPGRSELGGSP